MIKEIIEYEDYNGVKRTEEAYFALSKVEITEMEYSREGGLSNYYQKIVDAQDIPALVPIFRELILKAYGVKSDDGKRFIKKAPDGHRLADDFAESAAFEAFYMELVTNTDKASIFFNGIVPKIDTPTPMPEAK